MQETITDGIFRELNLSLNETPFLATWDKKEGYILIDIGDSSIITRADSLGGLVDAVMRGFNR